METVTVLSYVGAFLGGAVVMDLMWASRTGQLQRLLRRLGLMKPLPVYTYTHEDEDEIVYNHKPLEDAMNALIRNNAK